MNRCIDFRIVKTLACDMTLFGRDIGHTEFQREEHKKKTCCCMLGINRKLGAVFEGIYLLESDSFISKKFSRCDLVMMSFDAEQKDIVLDMLREYAVKNNCFAPIALLGCGDILFFPKLRYQDNFLVEYILRENLKKDTFSIVYAGMTEKIIA